MRDFLEIIFFICLIGFILFCLFSFAAKSGDCRNRCFNKGYKNYKYTTQCICYEKVDMEVIDEP